MAVNVPFLSHLNDDLAPGKNIDGETYWHELNENFRDDILTSKLFEEYMTPYKNVSLYVIGPYNEDDSIVTQ